MRRLLLIPYLLASASMALPTRADSGDVEGSHDYPGWTRLPGFEITDYDEDNPGEFTFPISRPLANDANHLDAVPVSGHRYVIRYEWSWNDAPPSLLKTQKHYEKLAKAAGYTIEKSGAVGDATETFHLTKSGRQIWVSLNPSSKVAVLTIVDSRMVVPELAGTSAPTETTPSPAPSTTPAVVPMTPPPQTPVVMTPAPAPKTPIVPTTPASASTPTNSEDPLYTALANEGRVVLPLKFLPGKPDLDANSQPVIDRVIAILKQHPELSLTIEGHTDLSGDEDQNLVLSKERAQTVRSQLIAGHIRSKRLTATGVGGTQPLADEGTAEGREKNRRIELIVRDGKTPKQPPPKDATQSAMIPETDASVLNPGPTHQIAPDGVDYYPNTDSTPSPAPKPSTSPKKTSH